MKFHPGLKSAGSLLGNRSHSGEAALPTSAERNSCPPLTGFKSGFKSDLEPLTRIFQVEESDTSGTL